MKKYVLLALISLIFTSCSSDNVEHTYPEKIGKKKYSRDGSKKETVFGDGGILSIMDEDENKGSSIGVNSYLWRATLDTVSFMPIASADPFGGIVITDWFSMPESPASEFKINVFIMSSTLRADGVKVTAFKREKDGKEYKNLAVDEATVRKIEDAILTKARELRHSDLPKTK